MIQQVNLYQDILRQQGQKPSIFNYVFGLILIIILLIASAWYFNTQIKQVQNQIETKQQHLNQEKAIVKQLEDKMPPLELDTALAAEVEGERKLVNELRKNLKILKDKSQYESKKLSAYFQALANQAYSDIWLTKISIEPQQQIVTFEGSTFQPAQTTAFLQRLQQEAIFNGHSFSQLQMTQSLEIDKLINFKLSTQKESLDAK